MFKIVEKRNFIAYSVCEMLSIEIFSLNHRRIGSFLRLGGAERCVGGPSLGGVYGFFNI